MPFDIIQDGGLTGFLFHFCTLCPFSVRPLSTISFKCSECCERFSLRLTDVTGSMFSVRAIDNLCREKVDDNMNRTVEFTHC